MNLMIGIGEDGSQVINRYGNEIDLPGGGTGRASLRQISIMMSS